MHMCVRYWKFAKTSRTAIFHLFAVQYWFINNFHTSHSRHKVLNCKLKITKKKILIELSCIVGLQKYGAIYGNKSIVLTNSL